MPLLEFYPKTGNFGLRVSKRGVDTSALMREHGFNLDTRRTTLDEAVLWTDTPYAAVPFFDHATPEAAAQLMGLQAEIERSWAKESQAHIACPPDQELAPFQKAGVAYALGRRNTLIGDQPGLGKTMQAVCFANEIGAKRVLVLVPAAIRLQWVARIRTWTTMRWPFTVYPILSSKHGVHPDAQWTVVSYDLARTPAIWRALVECRPYDLLIIDEGHNLKSVEAQRTRAVFGRLDGEDPLIPLASRAAAILDLTGTPLPNRPREAYTAARGLCFEAIDFMSEDLFRERFNPSEQGETEGGDIYVREEAGRHSELQSRLRGNFMVRRLKRDVQPQLKLPRIEIVHVEENGDVRAALAAERLLDIDPTKLPGPLDPIGGQIATVRRMMGRAVAPLAAAYVEMLLDGGEERVFLAAYHTEVMDALEERLRRYHPLRIDGSTSPNRRQKIVDDFGGSHRLLIGQILAVGIGTDGLQHSCSRGVCCEPDWTPGNNEQLINRLDRMGQKEKVLFSFLVAPGSFAERILGRSLEKAEDIDKTLDRRV